MMVICYNTVSLQWGIFDPLEIINHIVSPNKKQASGNTLFADAVDIIATMIFLKYPLCQGCHEMESLHHRYRGRE
jgi:hypothetical protein